MTELPITPADRDFLCSELKACACAAGARLLLTGGTGFFGKWLLPAAEVLGCETTVLSRHPERFLEEYPCWRARRGFRFVAGDVRDFALPGERFDYLIHAATPASLALERENPELMESIIVEGTHRVFDFAAAAGVTRALNLSSGAVYGPLAPGCRRYTEEQRCAPVTAYGRGKLRAEAAARDFGAVTARGFAFVGPFLPLDTHFAAGNFLRDAASGHEIVVRGDGTPQRSYLYGAELAVWLWRLLLAGAPGRAYNLGAEEAISIGELARRIGDLGGVPVRVLGEAQSRLQADCYLPDLERLRRELGLTVKIPLATALSRSLDWARQVVSGRNR